jgi:hypothetical protein
MPTVRAAPRSIDEYTTSFSPEVQAILEKIGWRSGTLHPMCRRQSATTFQRLPLRVP